MEIVEDELKGLVGDDFVLNWEVEDLEDIWLEGFLDDPDDALIFVTVELKV